MQESPEVKMAGNLVVVISGPTGVGKSELAFLLAEELDGELISCDSVQIFRGLQIGANKTALKHPRREHLLDVIDWKDEASRFTSFTAADFYELCMEKIEEVLGRNRVPVLVGGTGFYLDWILRGRPTAPATDPSALKEVECELATETDGTWSSALGRLAAVDPDYASKLLPNDFYRLKRALAVHRSTNLPLSSFTSRKRRIGELTDLDFRCFYLTAPREFIYRNIDARCEEMIQKGLIEEVFSLWRQGLGTECQAGRSIGYYETLNFLESIAAQRAEEAKRGFERGAAPDDAVAISKAFPTYLDNFKAATRQYSRKQENWFARRSEFKWIERPTTDHQTAALPLSKDAHPFSTIVKAIRMTREEYENDVNLQAENCSAHSLMTDIVRRRMKLYQSAPSRYSGRQLEEVVNRIGRLFSKIK